MPPNNNRNPSQGGARRKGPQSHPYIWLFLMGGLGVGLPLLFYGLLAFVAWIGGWRWEFLGHPDGLSWVLLALMVPPPFVSLLLWWFLLVTRAKQPTFRRGLLAGVCGAVFAFPLEGFWMGGVLLVLPVVTLSSPGRAWRACRTACGIGTGTRVRSLDRG